MGLFSKDFNKDFLKTMTSNEIRQLVAAKIAGQGNQIDAGSALPEILNRILDLIDATASDIPVVPTALENLAALTCVSEATSFESATDLTKENAATALGISADALDGLFGAQYLRLSYGEDGTSFYIVDVITPDSVTLGNGALVIGVTDGVYSITVA